MLSLFSYSKDIATLEGLLQGQTGNAVVLVGPQNIGKTTLGKILAAKMKLPFVDTDELLMLEYNSYSIAQLYLDIGAEQFRAKEIELVLNLDFNKAGIISFGGGTHLYHNYQDILEKTTVIMLSPMQIATVSQLQRIVAAYHLADHIIWRDNVAV